MERCDDSLRDRISISGDYSSHECGITVTQLQVEDAGTWECEVRTTFLFLLFQRFSERFQDRIMRTVNYNSC